VFVWLDGQYDLCISCFFRSWIVVCAWYVLKNLEWMRQTVHPWVVDSKRMRVSELSCPKPSPCRHDIFPVILRFRVKLMAHFWFELNGEDWGGVEELKYQGYLASALSWPQSLVPNCIAPVPLSCHAERLLQTNQAPDITQLATRAYKTHPFFCKLIQCY